MLDILSITFPIFAAIALGFASVRFGMFAESDMRIMGKYVQNIALPALLCAALVKRDLAEVLDISYMAVFAIGGLATIGAMYAILTLQSTGPARRAVGVMGASCPNSGFVGYPVMLLLFPDKAGIILALNFVVENFLLIPIGLVLLESSRDLTHKSRLRMLGALLLSILKRPLFVGLLAGMVIMLSGIDIPPAGIRLLDMLAASASALALFMIGGSLFGLPLKGNQVLATQIVIGKLVLHPALVALAAALLPMVGMPALGADMYKAVILSAAMPMFLIYTVFALDYGHEGVASIALVGATFGAFVTLSVLLAVLN
ncbi:AEC family transporter [Thalassovita aquimarina]|uniref:AEC family transporter n=1 Tax=Thalassovita aquimarina TaxID=2785917 RepID=A0ABS5HMU7_9RHOB|nr:AEC family transporter [Thalassovita aquimarina]MBR9650280.1 AEC family transporter [Thalassovita aquimarina]